MDARRGLAQLRQKDASRWKPGSGDGAELYGTSGGEGSLLSAAFAGNEDDIRMMLTRNAWFDAGRRMGLDLGQCLAVVLGFCLMAVALGGVAGAQAVSTTTVQGTVYLANGQAGAGTVSVSWPAFTTASGQSITAGHMMVTISPDGFLSVNLAPNVGATPAGLYYTAVYQMSDGTTSTQYWVVPTAAQASLGSVQAQVMPAAQAVQAVSKSYVDQSIAEATMSQLSAGGGALSGALYLNGDPSQPLQAADKHYVDETFSQAVPLAGGNMTGVLVAPAVNGLQAPAAGSSQATIQAAVSAAGTGGAVEIPATYAGTDSFTNPNGVYLRDLRQKSSQQFERSVKEFGAVCDGVTDDTSALQSAINYAETHGVSLTIPQGTCKTRTLVWHGESIGGFGKQVSALMGFPGQDVLASAPDSVNLLGYTRLHDMTIYVDQSLDVSCSAAVGRMPAGSCAVSRPVESKSIFSPGGNGLSGTTGTGAAWAVGNCAIAMPAVTGAGGNGLQVAELENLEIVATGVDPMAAQYPGAHSTHTCGLYLAQWPQWSEFRNIDINGLNTGIAIPALPGTTPAGLMSDSNRWEDITIHGTHGFTAAAGSHNVLDNVVAMAGNSAATGEPPTGLVLDFAGTQQGWIVRTPMVNPSWTAVQPQLTVTTAGGAVSRITVGAEHGLGFDPYGTQVPIAFSGSCSAQAAATVNSNGSIGTVAVTQGGVGCSGTTTASVNVSGSWDTAAPVNLISGQNMSLFGGNLLHGTGGYTVWNAAGSQSYGTQLAGGGGTLPGGGSYAGLLANGGLGSTYPVDQFPGVDFGAKLQACLGTVNASYGGTCDGRNFSGTVSMGSNVTISTPNATVLLPCATISTANQLIVTAGTRNVTLHGCALRGASTASGSQGGTVFLYSGASAMVQVGDPTYAANTMGFHMDNAVINTTGATNSTAQGLEAYRTQELDIDSLYFLGNQNQTGMTLDGTGNYTGGSFLGDQFDGFQTAVNAIGHQVTSAATTDWMNASTFVRLHIDCPTSGGSPIGGTFGINLQQGDGNTFTGGDVEGCSTALHLGANAQNNTIVGLRNENSTNQVVADAGSSYNNWMTGGTMFTGQLTDNGTRNSFLDTFHRSFNGLNGDWYGSQKDATVTNHWRLGTGVGNERGLMNEIQTDYGYRWTEGYTDATAGEQFYQVQDLMNNVNRLSIGQYNNGQSSTNNQTVLNAAGTGAVVLNGSNNSGTGGVVIGSGGPTETTVATIDKTGNAQFTGMLQVGGVSTFINTPTVKNQVDAEIDAVLWAGLTQSQKESLIYKDWNGNSQWYMEKDASNNWELNSATGGLDSFKAYQSSNSGDTYINASNSSGAVRVNYETGAGTAFKIYGGSSGSLYASFTAPNAIEFPGLAATIGANCLQVDNSGYISNIGVPCGTGNGNGTVSSGNAGQIAYYTANGTLVGGVSAVPITAGGTGAANGSAALQNLGAFAYPGGSGIPFGLSSSTSRQATSGDLNALLGYSPLKPANNLSDVGSSAAALANLGGQAALGFTPLKPANNLSDLASPTAALATLGGVPLAGGTMTGELTATQFNGPLTGAVTGNVTGNVSGTSANVTGTVLLANGGTGAATAAAALANLGAAALAGATFTGPVNAPAVVANTFRGALDATTFSGADMCAKINACLATGAGVTCDARGFTGAQGVTAPYCSANVVATADNQTILLNGNLHWNMGSYNIFKSSTFGGFRVIGGGRSSGGLGQEPGCAYSTPVGTGTCIFSSNATAMIQLGDGTVNYSGSTGYPAIHSVIADLSLISTSSTADAMLLISEWEDQINSVQTWAIGGSSGASFHEQGVASYPACSWGWGAKVNYPDFAGFKRGWFSDAATTIGSCTAIIGSSNLGASQFYGGYVSTNTTNGIGIDWSGLTLTDAAFGTDFENNSVCMHIQGSENMFYGRCEGGSNAITVQLDGVIGAAQSNDLGGIYNTGSHISVINGGNPDNNHFHSNSSPKTDGPTGNESINTQLNTPLYIKWGAGATSGTSQNIFQQFGTDISGSFVSQFHWQYAPSNNTFNLLDSVTGGGQEHLSVGQNGSTLLNAFGTQGIAFNYNTGMSGAYSMENYCGGTSVCWHIDLSGNEVANSFTGSGAGLTGTGAGFTAGNATNAAAVPLSGISGLGTGVPAALALAPNVAGGIGLWSANLNSAYALNASNTLNNTFFTYNANLGSITGSQNSLFGFQAGTSMTSDGSNTFVGWESGYRQNGGSNNTFIGHAAGQYTTTGIDQVCIGYGGCNGSGTYPTGNYVVGIGQASAAGSGVNNVAIGGYSQTNQTTGYENVSLGYDSGDQLTSGYLNVTIGHKSGGTTLATGNGDTLIGPNTDVQGAADTNETAIGNGVTGNGSNTVSLGNSSVTGTYLQGTQHITATAPTASVGSVATYSTNAGGEITGLSAATSVTITFANGGWTNAAFCTATPSTTLATVVYNSSQSKTAVTFTFPALTGNLFYQCEGN